MTVEFAANSIEWGYGQLADGNLVCSGCGCLVYPQYQDQHDGWHKWVATLAMRTNQLYRAAVAFTESQEPPK